jgi:hypothetical protein
MEKQKLINGLKIGTNLFLALAILLLVWQFIKADALTKDIALYNQPEALVQTYEKITGFGCICGLGVEERFAETINFSSKNNLVPLNLKSLNESLK